MKNIAIFTLIIALAGVTSFTTHALAQASTQQPTTKEGTKTTTTYACPMHPEVTSTTAGSKCPQCGMNLTPVQTTK